MATIIRKTFSNFKEETRLLLIKDIATYIKRKRKEGFTSRPMRPLEPWLIDMALEEIDSNEGEVEKIFVTERDNICKS